MWFVFSSRFFGNFISIAFGRKCVGICVAVWRYRVLDVQPHNVRISYAHVYTVSVLDHLKFQARFCCSWNNARTRSESIQQNAIAILPHSNFFIKSMRLNNIEASLWQCKGRTDERKRERETHAQATTVNLISSKSCDTLRSEQQKKLLTHRFSVEIVN